MSPDDTRPVVHDADTFPAERAFVTSRAACAAGNRVRRMDRTGAPRTLVGPAGFTFPVARVDLRNGGGGESSCGRLMGKTIR